MYLKRPFEFFQLDEITFFLDSLFILSYILFATLLPWPDNLLLTQKK